MPRKPHAARRAGLYARVSTDDRGQDPETQLRQLREYAARRGFTITAEFVDHASGTRDDQPSYKRLLVLLCHKLPIWIGNQQLAGIGQPLANR